MNNKIWEIYKKVDKKIKLTFLFQILAFVFGYLITFIIARFFGSKSLGIYSLTIGILNVLVLIPTLGMQTSIVRFIGQIKNEFEDSLIIYLLKKMLKLSFLIAFLLGLILFWGADYISLHIFYKKTLILPLKIIAFVLPIYSLLSLVAGFFRGVNKPHKTILYKSTLIFILVVLIISLIHFFNYKYFYLPVIVHLLIIFLVTIISFFDIMFYLKKINTNKYNFNNGLKKFNITFNYKKIISISYPIFLSGSINLIANWINIFMIGAFKNEVDVGMYTIAFKTVTASGMFLMVLNTVSAPTISDLFWSGNIGKLVLYIQRNTKIIFIISFPILLFITLFPNFILSIFGKEFLTVGTTMLVLAIGQIITISCGQIGILMNMVGFEKDYRNIITLSLLINVILNIYLIPEFGVLGAAFSNLLSNIYRNVFAEIKVYRKLGFWAGYPVLIKTKN